MRRRLGRIRWFVQFSIGAVLMVSCGGGLAESTTTTTSPVTAEVTTVTEATTSTTRGEFADFNADGAVRIGLATDGRRDDGGYNQALVASVERVSDSGDLGTPIIVDQVDPVGADTVLRDMVGQGADIMVIGSVILTDSLPTLLLEFPDVFWYCNCGSDYSVTEGLLISRVLRDEVWFSAGYATGLLMQDGEGTAVAFLGCCALDLEVESYDAFLRGLQQVDPAFTMTYVETGAYRFDFNNIDGATDAFQEVLIEGAVAVVPFLADPALRQIAQLANESGVIVMSAGSSTACDDAELRFDFQVKFDTADFIEPILIEVITGAAVEGTTRDFRVGIDEEVGAEFCAGVSPDQVAALDLMNARIGAGEL